MQWLYRNILVPAFEAGWHRRGTFRYLRELEKSQWLTADELRERQGASLRKVLEHAAANCPYYAEEWSRLGLDARRVQSIADLARWPLVDRDTIRVHRQKMRSQQPGRKLISKATGGSSGVPLQFDLDGESNDRRMAAWHRGYGWAGAGVGTKQFYLWGGPVGKPSRRKRLKDWFYHAIYRRQVVSSFNMTDDRAEWYLRQLNQSRPDAIVAYTNPLYHFARELDERKLAPFSPKTIVVGAEKLHAFQRELIERVFRAPVFETYGSREFMLIGAECPEHAGLHLTMENLLVEILNDDGSATAAGEEGNVAVTDLTNYGMPFIRYVNGDRAIAGFEICGCGRGLPLLKQVVGRRLDMLTTSDGRRIAGEFFPHLLKDYAAIRRFQVVQSMPDQIVVRMVVKGEWNDQSRASLESDIRGVVGFAVSLQLEEVEDIPLTAGGKLRVVVNQCETHDQKVTSRS